MSLRHVLIVAAALPAVVPLAGCGSSDTSSASTGSTAAAAPAQPSTSSPAASAGTVRVAARHLTVSMSEFKFRPATVTAKAGRLRVTARNAGHVTHELVLLRTNAAAGALKARKGRVSESASVGEIAELKPGKTASHTFRLKPGKYVFVCNVPGHYQGGMHGALVVR